MLFLMADELRTIDLRNLHDAIRVMNESTQGTSLECHLDMFSFLSLWKYWNFSHEHSLIRYLDDEPAAIILTCTDPDARDAYTFYWGAIPKFRSRRIALPLFDACCNKLHEDGYLTLYGVSSPDRPVRRYRFINAHSQRQLVDMQAQSLNLPTTDARYEVRPVEIAGLSQVMLPTDDSVHWCQRQAFLHNAIPFLQFLGAFAGGLPAAYAVVHPQPSGTTLVDLRSSENNLAAGHELLRWLLIQNYRSPFTAIFVSEQSYGYSLLKAAGFIVKSQFATLSRDLRTSSSAGIVRP
jgi:hypothetical protein